MYTVIVAEDEADVREAIVQGLDWETLGFEVIDSAENGQEAWDQFAKHTPDVLLTDIKMPFMDGLHLSGLVKHKHPGTRIVILSGYDEFEYAQKALKLQVDEYVLKPFSTEELLEVLAKVRNELDNEAAEKKNLDSLKEHYRKSLPVLRENFLASLMMRQLKKREIEEKSVLYDIPLSGRGFQVSVVSLDLPGAGAGAELKDGEVPRSASVSLKDSEDQELMLFASLNIAEEIAAERELGRVFLHNSQIVVLSIRDEEEAEAVTALTISVLEEIRQAVLRYLKFTVTVGIGIVVHEPSGLSYSYKDAVLALDYRVILGGNRLVSIADVEKRLGEKVRFDELKEESLIRCIKLGTAAELKDNVDALFQGLLESPVSVKEYQLYLMEIVTAILKAAKDADADLDAVFGDNMAPFAELHQFRTLEEAKGWLIAICTRIMGSIAVVRQSVYKNLVEEAVAYTRANYPDSGISINKVCSQLHISTGYFSSIFKKETKMTFVAYLLHIRMEAAKELLRTTDLKAFEIAEKVGYTEPNYFSFSFKKHVGISPKEYRSSIRGG
ncbi:MAG: transcriptional regulator [Paenibacillaceae bacterium]|jgi:two-component system response regulator YesN|nr:transcriptional regulator [Paenibacillaceae bacterium]